MSKIPANLTTAETEITNQRRRSLLVSSLRLSLAATVFGTTVASTVASAELCADPDELSGVDRSFRKYVEYTESSKTVGETCGGCASFQPPKQGECGTCRAVAGSINANGHCTGWSARVEKR